MNLYFVHMEGFIQTFSPRLQFYNDYKLQTDAMIITRLNKIQWILREFLACYEQF